MNFRITFLLRAGTALGYTVRAKSIPEAVYRGIGKLANTRPQIPDDEVMQMIIARLEEEKA